MADCHMTGVGTPPTFLQNTHPSKPKCGCTNSLLCCSGKNSDRVSYSVLTILMIGSWVTFFTTGILGTVDICSRDEETQNRAPLQFVLSGIFCVAAVLLTVTLSYAQKKENERKKEYIQIM